MVYFLNMNRFIYFLAVILLFQSTAFGIEEVRKVYLNEAMDVALKNNINLQVAKIDINIAQNEIKTANRVQNPSVEAYSFFGGAGNYEPKQFGLSQSIEVAKRKARKNLAEANLNLVQKNVEYTTFDLKMAVREAYINLVATKSILNTLEQQQSLQEELLKIAQNKVKIYKAPEIDAIQAEIALNQMITQVNTARADVKTALANFNKIINNSDNVIYDSMDKLFAEENNFKEMMTPPPTLQFPEPKEIIDKILENRYDIKIVKQEIDIAEKNLTLVTRQRIPDIQVSGGYAFLPGRYSSNGNFNNGAYVGANLVNIPLFYNYSPEIQNASLKLQQAELKYTYVKDKAIKDITAAYDRFLASVDNLNRYETKIISNSEKLIETSKKTYEAGKSDITSLIVMKQAYKSIIIGYTMALTEYYNSWTNFLREVNDEDFELKEVFL